MTTTMIPVPGPVGTIVEFPKRPFAGVGGIGWKKRRAIVVGIDIARNEATMEPWSRPSKGWRRHLRRRKAAR